jgi:hypothetical protein
MKIKSINNVFLDVKICKVNIVEKEKKFGGFGALC